MNIIENSKDKLVIRMERNESLMNAIRRSVTEIKTLAIEEVEIFKNDSALYDEVLAHRLGLIPLKTEKNMNSKTKIDFKLSKKGPCTVYAEDLEGSAEIIYPKIPITILGENHKLELVATATLGDGVYHDKHTPGIFYYRFLLQVNSSPEADKIIQESKGLIKPEKKGSKWICDLDEAVVDKIVEKNKDSVTDSEEMIVVIESFGMLTAKEIFLKACDAIVDNLDEVEKLIK